MTCIYIARKLFLDYNNKKQMRYFEKRVYPSTATRHRLLGTKRRKEAFSHMDSDRALNCNAKTTKL